MAVVLNFDGERSITLIVQILLNDRGMNSAYSMRRECFFLKRSLHWFFSEKVFFIKLNTHGMG